MSCEAYNPLDGGGYPLPPQSDRELKQQVSQAAKLVRRDVAIGPIISIGQVGCVGPAHLILECLPRLLAVRQLAARTPGAALQVRSTNTLNEAVIQAAGLDRSVPMSGKELAGPLVVLPESAHCGHPGVA